ncbi:hypothetical protein [Aquihabitans sp. McL0605]|uniref:hypothetical protein n=1 Tax=Aquihabitans sp. McL0605 TaxID=3415671 RepID=UPI003CFAC013
MSLDQPSFDPVPAQGTGSSEFSLPELFYLTHRELIDEWARLKSSAASAQDAWLTEIAVPAIASLAEDRGVDHQSFDEGRYRSSLLVIPGTDEHRGRPSVGIGLCWSSASLEAPFVAIDVDLSAPRGPETREAVLVAGARDLRSANGYKKERRWPAWRWVAVPPQWWNDLDAMLQLILDDVTATFELFESPLRSGLSAAATEPGDAPEPAVIDAAGP